ncbi:MAG: response regulator [Planctomycetota bacterium]|nr:response regulator [Planctomycetota bacterium]
MPISQAARVLVVDDEPELRELLSDTLSSPQLQVSVAGSGQEAIDLASAQQPDLLVTDVHLGDCSGLEVIDRLRSFAGDLPAVVITGYGDPAVLTEASRRHPVELMTKPLDLDRLRATIHQELDRRSESDHLRRRTIRLRRLAKRINHQRKDAQYKLETTCAALSDAYRNLSGQIGAYKVVIDYQRDLLTTKNDDDVFRTLFRLFVRRSGPVFGVAMVCDSNADLQITGRFGVPVPDGPNFCSQIAQPVVDAVLANPQCMLIDAGEEADAFENSIRRYLVGVSILAVPLIPAPGEMIGLVALYRKGEQPFLDTDVALAEMIASSTATTIRRND